MSLPYFGSDLNRRSSRWISKELDPVELQAPDLDIFSNHIFCPLFFLCSSYLYLYPLYSDHFKMPAIFYFAWEKIRFLPASQFVCLVRYFVVIHPLLHNLEFSLKEPDYCLVPMEIWWVSEILQLNKASALWLIPHYIIAEKHAFRSCSCDSQRKGQRQK